MDTWLYILAGIAGLMYIGAPLVVLTTLKQVREPVFEELDPDSDALPKEVVAHLVESIQALTQEGFVLVNYYEPQGLGANVKTYLALLENRAKNDLAIAVGMFSTQGGSLAAQSLHVEFSNLFEDGSSVSTNNSPQLMVTAPLPRRTVGLFPLVKDPRRLYAIHRKQLKRHGGTKRPIPAREGLVPYLVASVQREHQAQEDAGYFRLSGENYVPTLKGAFLMTWKLLPPLSLLLAWRREHRGRALLAELGL